MNKELIEYVRERVDGNELARAWEEIDKWRCPLSYADNRLYNEIDELVDYYCFEHDIDRYDYDPEEYTWEDFDPDYIFEEL